MISKLISGNRRGLTRMSREEMIVAAEMGQTEGTLVEKETRIIRNLLRLTHILVKDIMEPRESVFALPKTTLVREVMDLHGHELYSRIPVYDTGPHNIVGVVLRFNVFNASSDGLQDLPIERLMSPIHRIKQTERVSRVIDEFISRREHLFAVVDEQDRFVGIVSLEDAIEALLGVEIEDEIDNVEEMRERARKRWDERMRQRAGQNAGQTIQK